MNQSLQEKFAPKNSCWGCGPANTEGLRIRSFPKGDEVVAEWKPEQKYEAFPGVLNGGIIGTLLDCHCNWAAAYHLMKRAGTDRSEERRVGKECRVGRAPLHEKRKRR